MPPKKRPRGKGVISDAVERIRNWFFPPSQLSASANAVFEKLKEKKISDITIRRAPIIQAVDSLLNFISSGKFNEAKKSSGYDKMFHLGVIITLENGSKIILEKNERINISTSWKSEADTEYMKTEYASEMTLQELMAKAESQMGKFKFYQYNAFENNCQDFILGIVRASGALTPDVIKFVKQNTKQLLEKLPWYVKKFSQFATDTAAKVNQILGGRGRRKKRVIKAVVKKPVKPLAKRKTKKKVK